MLEFYLFILDYIKYPLKYLMKNHIVLIFLVFSVNCFSFVYAPIRHNIMTTCLILFWSPVAAKTALIYHDMDTTGPLKLCCGI